MTAMTTKRVLKRLSAVAVRRLAIFLMAVLPSRICWRLIRPTPRRVIARLGYRHRSPLNFIQIGSNDGCHGDPLHDTIIDRGWTGILVEPIAPLFRRLQKTYADVPGLRFANVAIANSPGKKVIYWVPASPGDPPWIDQLGSFSRSNVEKHQGIVNVRGRIVEESVECITYGDLLIEHGVTSLGLLHVDVEGFDYEIIKQVNFDDASAPKYVLYEHKHLSDSDAAATEGLLRTHGYKLLRLENDTFAHR